MKDFFEPRLVVLMDREEILWLLMSSEWAITVELGLIDPIEKSLSFNDDLSLVVVRDLEILEMLDILNMLLLRVCLFYPNPLLYVFLNNYYNKYY